MAKKYEELSFTDDFMFGKIMYHRMDLCKELLELILDRKIRRITYPEPQKPVAITADAKGVRFDMPKYAERLPVAGFLYLYRGQ